MSDMNNLERAHFTASANRRDGYLNVLLITTGSVASIKAPLIVTELKKVITYYPCR
jgi:phosphopantothenoylcysteine decarboxylase